LLGTRAHDTAWTEQQLFLQQCGNAPRARPNDFLRHFFVTLLTIFRIVDCTTWPSRPRDRPGFSAATERASAKTPFEKIRLGRKQIRSKNAQAKANKRQ
jgi:hypothetical protein